MAVLTFKTPQVRTDFLPLPPVKCQSFTVSGIKKLEPSRKTNADVFTYSVSLNKREGRKRVFLK